jgi:hypothetical protein
MSFFTFFVPTASSLITASDHLSVAIQFLAETLKKQRQENHSRTKFHLYHLTIVQPFKLFSKFIVDAFCSRNSNPAHQCTMSFASKTFIVYSLSFFLNLFLYLINFAEKIDFDSVSPT